MRIRLPRFTRPLVASQAGSSPGITPTRWGAVVGLAGVVTLLLVALPRPAVADPQAARASSNVVLVTDQEVIKEDLYAVGQVVSIQGVVEGDLFFAASELLEITGHVQGNVVGLADTTRITGQVGGSVRIIGRDISVAGEVGGDVLGIGWQVSTGGSIGRDLLVWARTLVAGGSVGRNVEGQTWGDTTLSGSVGQDVEMTVRQLRLLDGTDIAQDLTYRSTRPAQVEPGVAVLGTSIRRSPVSPNLSLGAGRTMIRVTFFLFYVLVGLLALRLLSGLDFSAGRIRSQPVRCLLYGLGAFLVLFGLPVVLVWLMVALVGFSLWLLAVVALLFLILGLGWVVLAVLATIPALVTAGRLVVRRPVSPYAAFLVTVLPFALSLLIPFYVGTVLFALAIILGMGAMTSIIGQPTRASG